MILLLLKAIASTYYINIVDTTGRSSKFISTNKQTSKKVEVTKLYEPSDKKFTNVRYFTLTDDDNNISLVSSFSNNFTSISFKIHLIDDVPFAFEVTNSRLRGSSVECSFINPRKVSGPAISMNQHAYNPNNDDKENQEPPSLLGFISQHWFYLLMGLLVLRLLR